MQYRSEIDGLRALAVVPVVFYHAGFSFFKGGFVGVDIFFVISGYLITSILLEEYRSNGTISIMNFYNRRIRRIMPALVFVVMATSVASYFWLAPQLLANYGKSLISTLTFISNIFFYKSTGYFDMAAELNPLLHTWSLSVEEQFYIFFPPLVLFFLRVKKVLLVPCLVLISAVSLMLSVHFIGDHQSMVFYLIFFRAWELLAGALCAVWLSSTGLKSWPIPPMLRLMLAALGVVLIILSVGLMHDRLAFPALWATPVVTGTMLVILFSNGNLVGSVLSWRLFVWVGLISYSLYLWHQPIFAFAKLRLIGELSVLAYLGLIGLAVSLAYISWRYVEAPFRRRNTISIMKVYGSGALAAAVLLTYGGLCYITDGARFRFSEEVLSVIESKTNNSESVCAQKVQLLNLEGVVFCEFGDLDQPLSLVLLGDSHAEMLVGSLDQELKSLGKKGMYLLNWNCHVIPGLAGNRGHRDNLDVCKSSTDAVLGFIEEHHAASIFSARWTFRIAPVEGYMDSVDFDNGEGGVERANKAYENYAIVNGQRSNSAADIENTTLRYMTKLAQSSDPMVLINPVPEVGWDLPAYNLSYYLSNGAIVDSITTGYDVYLARHKFFMERIAEPMKQSGVTIVRPDQYLCSKPSNVCYAQKKGEPFYLDDDHLNARGIKAILGQILAGVF